MASGKRRPARRGKHVPQRTCVACQQTWDKRTLVRVVRAPDGVHVDLTGKAAGRGAYLHRKLSCWERALSGEALRQALKLEAALAPAERAELLEFARALPAELAQ